MLHAQTPPPPPSQGNSSQPSPASLFIQRLQGSRAASLDTRSTASSSPSPPQAAGKVHDPVVGNVSVGGGADMRRMNSMRSVVTKDGVSFGAAASNLSSPAFQPPAASWHPLFSHHAPPPRQPAAGHIRTPSPSFMSDPGPSCPPSPTMSDFSNVSVGAFSPASAFLQHFSAPTQTFLPPDAEGAVVQGYKLGKILGRGGFSAVRKAVHASTGEVFACKIVKRDDLSDRSGSLEKFEEEIRTWQDLPRHPALLPLLEMHRTADITFLFIPYMSGGSLLDVLKKEGGSDRTARKWFTGIVAAVSAMHDGFDGFSGGLLHGDLKLDNFLVDHRGTVMVCDFYMARWVGRSERTATIPPPLNSGINRYSTLPSNFQSGRYPSPYRAANSHQMHRPSNEHVIGNTSNALPAQPFPSASLPYAPPELLRAPPSGPSLAQDIWAVGIILYALLTGRLPFADAFDPRLQMKILRGTWEEPLNLGREWLECLRGCLDGDRNRRWTIKQVKDSDAFMGWSEVQNRSKSRSRSRARGMGLGEGLLDGYRRDGSQPVPIASPIHRGRNGQKVSRSQERGLPEACISARLAVHHADTPRSRSVSASRSRSSGAHRTMFTLDPPELAKGLEAVDISRGRSGRRDMFAPSSASGSNLNYARPQGTPSNYGNPMPIPIDSYSRSGSQSRHQGPLPRSAPAQSSDFRAAMAMGFKDFTYNHNHSPVPSAAPDLYPYRSSPTRSDSRQSQIGDSPSARRSLSRARADSSSHSRPRENSVHSSGGTKWDTVPERYEYGQGLDAVHEDSRARGRRGRSRDASWSRVMGGASKREQSK